jgi:hypothetical protein
MRSVIRACIILCYTLMGVFIAEGQWFPVALFFALGVLSFVVYEHMED